MKIIVNNSTSRFDSISEKIQIELKSLLSYKNKNVGFQIQKAKHRLNFLVRDYADEKQIRQAEHILNGLQKKEIVYLLNDKNEFPTGLLSIIEKYLKKQNIEYTIIDERIRPQSYLPLTFKCKQHDLRYYQKEIVNLCIEKGRAAIESCTGSGKSAIIVNLIKELGVRTLVIVPNVNLLNQLHRQLVHAFGSKYIGIVGDGKIKDKKEIVVATVQTLANQDKEFFEGYECILLDESHHSGAETYTQLNEEMWNHIYFRFFFTGTAYRNDGSDMSLIGVISDVDYRYPAYKAIQEGFLSPPVFMVNRNKLSPYNTKASVKIKLKNGKIKQSYDYVHVYQHFIVDNDNRNQLIVENTKGLSDSGLKTIVLVDRIEHGEKLHSMLPNSVFINGNTKDNEKVIDNFNMEKIPILIGTDVIGEGVDLVGADALVMACGGKAKSDIVQKIGRVLRLKEGKDKAIIVDYLDVNVEPFSKHALERIEIYKEYHSIIEYI